MVSSNQHSLEQYHRVYPKDITADVTIDPLDKVHVFHNASASGNITATLPSASLCRGFYSFHFTALDSNSGIVNDPDGSTLVTLTTAGNYGLFYSDGHNWITVVTSTG
jgi:hypothetical protein